MKKILLSGIVLTSLLIVGCSSNEESSSSTGTNSSSIEQNKAIQNSTSSETAESSSTEDISETLRMVESIDLPVTEIKEYEDFEVADFAYESLNATSFYPGEKISGESIGESNVILLVQYADQQQVKLSTDNFDKMTATGNDMYWKQYRVIAEKNVIVSAGKGLDETTFNQYSDALSTVE